MDMYAGGQRSGNIKLEFWRQGWSSLRFSTSEVYIQFLVVIPATSAPNQILVPPQSSYSVFFGLPPILNYSSVQVVIHLLDSHAGEKFLFLSPHFSIN